MSKRAAARGASTGPVTAVAAAVAGGQTRAVDVVRRALELVARHNPKLNAVTVLRDGVAMDDAERLDRALADGAAPGPLAGVPVLVKDLEDVTGMRTTYGSLMFADAPDAVQDGRVPARLRAAGAIIIGKTNLSEFATEGYTANLLYGVTRNPWNTALSPGGSSGGSAAALAAGLVPIATATDGGGSIRIPAALCGLVGLKPSHGLIGRRPIPDWIDLSTSGPLATCVEDLRLLLKVQAGPVAGDPDAMPYALAPATNGPCHLMAAHRTADLGPLPPAIASQFESGVGALSDVLRLPVRWLEPDEVFPTGSVESDWQTLATPELVNSLGRGWITANLSRMHPAAAAFLQHGLGVSIDEYLEARRRRFGYVGRMDVLLGEAGLLVTPTVAAEGWLADGRLTDDAEVGMLPPEVISTKVQNMTGHPAVSLPAGISSNGLPFGLQVTGPRFADALLLDVAQAWEEAYPWQRVAPGFLPFEALLE